MLVKSRNCGHFVYNQQSHYFLLIFLCWMENCCLPLLHIIAFLSQSLSSTVEKIGAINVTSLNKTYVQHFPQKCKFIFWLNLVKLLLNFHNHNTSVLWNGKAVSTSKIFRTEFRVALPRFLSQSHWLVAIWSWAAQTWVS